MTTPRGDSKLWRKQLNVNELANHVSHCKAPPSSTTDQGSRLEQLSTWLFPHLPGLTVLKTNVFSADGAHEVDIPLYNDVAAPGALASLGTPVFVECKNYDRKVGGQEVAWFDHKLVQGGSTGGILVAAKGVTGDSRERTFAQAVIAYALRAQPARRILVVTLDELGALTSTDGLRDLLIRKIMAGATGDPL